MSSTQLPFTLQSHSSVLFKGRVWLIGGSYNGVNSRKVFYSFDCVNWSESGSDCLPFSITYHTTLVYHNRVYLIGGTTSGLTSRKVLVSDDCTTWTELGTDSLPIGIYRHASIVFQDMMLVIAGYNSTNIASKVLRSTDGINWLGYDLTGLPLAIHSHSSAVYGGFVWVIGGTGNSGRSNRVFKSSDAIIWSESSVFPIPTFRAPSVNFKGKTYIVGGCYILSMEAYKRVYSSPDCINWTVPGLLTISVLNNSSVVHSNRIWSMGGCNAANAPYNRVLNSTDGILWSNLISISGWVIGTLYSIEWNPLTYYYSSGPQGLVSDRIKIELSRDGGDTWEVLNPYALNTGKFIYTASGLTAPSCCVRVSGVTHPETTETSDSFYICNRVLVIGDSHTIRWIRHDFYYGSDSAGYNLDRIKIELSRDNGLTWTTISASAPNTESYVYSFTGLSAAFQCLIRLTGVNNPLLSKIVDSFSLVDSHISYTSITRYTTPLHTKNTVPPTLFLSSSQSGFEDFLFLSIGEIVQLSSSASLVDLISKINEFLIKFSNSNLLTAESISSISESSI